MEYCSIADYSKLTGKSRFIITELFKTGQIKGKVINKRTIILEMPDFSNKIVKGYINDDGGDDIINAKRKVIENEAKRIGAVLSGVVVEKSMENIELLKMLMDETTDMIIVSTISDIGDWPKFNHTKAKMLKLGKVLYLIPFIENIT